MKLKAIFIGVLFSIHLIFINCSKRDDFTFLKGPYLGQKPPGMKPEIFAPGIVSTEEYKEFGCTFSPDGTECYFTRGSIEYRRNAIMVSRFKNGRWTEPAPAPFSGTYYDDEPHINTDGSLLFFGSERPKPVVSERKYGLWMMKRSGDHWSEPLYYGLGMYVTSARNGTIYYTVRINDKDWGIVKARLVNGKYVEPELLGGDINSPYFDGHPCIAPDESFLIFDSKRPGAVGGEGDIDLYICFPKEDGQWGAAIHLGDRINTPQEEHVASLSPDGKYLFYAHGPPERWDIYWVDAKIIEDLKPN